MSTLREGWRPHRAWLLTASCACFGLLPQATPAVSVSAGLCGLGPQVDAQLLAPRKGDVAIKEARLIVEYNDTGQDVGLQASLDAEPWKTMSIVSPDRCRIFEVQGKGRLGRLGLTELFVETEEPTITEVPLAQFLARFPEGAYQFIGTTTDGARLVGTAMFTHRIPDVPVVLSPLEGSVVNPANAVISWEPVTGPPGIQIVEYEVIVERVDVKPKRVFDIHVPGTSTSVTVPPQFLEPGIEYLFEVLSIEIGRNQTIRESFFFTP